MELERDSALSEEARLERIVLRFESTGYKLQKVEDDTMVFEIPGRSSISIAFDGCINVLFLGPLIPAYLLGHLIASGGSGSKGEELRYRPDMGALVEQPRSKRRWLRFWGD